MPLKNMLAGCFFLMIVANSYGQKEIEPKAVSFNKPWLTTSSYAMDWFALRDGQKVKVGTVLTEVKVTDKTVTVITDVKMAGRAMQWKDSTIAEAGSFKPIYHSSYNPSRDMVLNFGNIVTGFYHDKQTNTKTNISDTLSTHYFDSNIYPLLIRLSPLKAGYTATMPIYDYNLKGQKGIVKAYIEKVESGVLQDLNGGNVEVWIVTVSDELNPESKSASTYFIGKKDRKLLKQEMNANGRKMEMVLVQ